MWTLLHPQICSPGLVYSYGANGLADVEIAPPPIRVQGLVYSSLQTDWRMWTLLHPLSVWPSLLLWRERVGGCGDCSTPHPRARFGLFFVTNRLANVDIASPPDLFIWPSLLLWGKWVGGFHPSSMRKVWLILRYKQIGGCGHCFTPGSVRLA